MEHLNHPKAHPDDIIQLIKKDHKPLKSLLAILKNDNVPYLEKKDAFQKLAPLLEAHMKPEQETWYKSLKHDHAFTVEITEGELEHRLADQICKDMKITTNERSFMSKAKVLAEMVDHHIKVEERDLLPDFESATTLDERIELGLIYLEMQQRIESLQNAERHQFSASSLNDMQG
ncbi:hemerythrin domain-containing protein [Bdellovibrio sp. SKB1291214]|uniref:hemerythrin domain-containing protein n=1 Tax=Bdellovibrio sp. SKB1291214 TaxID=1732569 RepID=UPI000B51BBB5|nr:hemerythrin domain-containing protein [Bdellovibrio sp. SKB1291214]UYL09057.1 hemerythrin domain-containing protein [Bdellovibrio sp. SKB1291214]